MSRIRRAVQALAPYVPGEQPASTDITKLNTNENPYPPSPAVREVLNDFALNRLRTYPDPTSRALREALAQVHRCRPEQIVVGNGSDELLALCLRAFVERDGIVGFFEPSYSLYPVLAAIEELRTAPVPLGPGSSVPPDVCDTPLFFITNPNAPTSMLFPREEIFAFSRRTRGVLLVDEAYADFACENCLDLALASGNVLVARTLSKAYSLAGARLGYLVGPEPLIEAVTKIKDSYNVNAMTQQVALAAVRDQHHMRQNVERIQHTRERTAGELQAMGFMVYPSETNFLWVKPEWMTAEHLFMHLRAMHFYVRYFPGGRTGDHLRITIGTDEEMKALIDAIRILQ